MRNLIVLTLLFTLLSVVASSQSCFPQGIQFTTQQQIDNFHLNHPDCTSIEGNVRICGSTITNLDSLIVLISIDGDLEIESDPILISLEGLMNLTAVGGDLRIGFNALLASLSGLDNLSGVGGYLTISYNNALANLSGLDGLITVGEGMLIHSNILLESMSALSNLTTVSIELQVFSNPVLTNLLGIENVDASSVDLLRIYDNPSLSDCQVQSICDYLANPPGEIDIFSNAGGCNNPPEISADCGIAQVCLPYGNYYFLDQSDIDNFQSDYPGCTLLGGSVQIKGDDIWNLTGLSTVISIGKDLEISHNPNLIDLSGLENMMSTGRTVKIQYNESLANLAGLEALTTIGGILSIAYNDSLPNLDGLQALTSIGSDLGIAHNDKLVDLSGLNNLSFVGRNLSIASNPALKNVTALDALEEIYGYLAIESNDSLASLAGLDNIDYMTIWQLTIMSNNILSECEVKSVCDYLTAVGWADIFDNADGCDNSTEVEAACEVGIDESPVNGQRSAVRIYPNPSSSEFIIEIPGISGNTDLVIFNLSGREMARQQISNPLTVIDISHLPGGVYFVRITSDTMIKVAKVVKQ